jgi:hypothetical protein
MVIWRRVDHEGASVAIQDVRCGVAQPQRGDRVERLVGRGAIRLDEEVLQIPRVRAIEVAQPVLALTWIEVFAGTGELRWGAGGHLMDVDPVHAWGEATGLHSDMQACRILSEDRHTNWAATGILKRGPGMEFCLHKRAGQAACPHAAVCS